MTNKIDIKQEMLAQVDLDAMNELVSHFVGGTVDLSEHLDNWAEEKQHLYKLMGNKLMIEKEVDGTVDFHDLKILLQKLYVELEGKHYRLVRELIRSLTREDILENKLECNLNVFNKKFNKGAKISKILKNFVPAKYVEELNIKYSMFLQDCKSKGRLILSIHPMDYLTMSLNKNDWQSCHRLEGEYQAGVFSYMQDEYTAIGYMCGKEDIVYEEYGGIKWNNKRWRNVVYVAHDNLYAAFSRQYPNKNNVNARELRSIVGHMFADTKGCEPEWTTTTDSSTMYDLILDKCDCPLHYNDIQHENGEHAMITMKSDKAKMEPIEVGSDVRCVVKDCNDWVDNPEYIECCDCSGHYDNEYY